MKGERYRELLLLVSDEGEVHLQVAGGPEHVELEELTIVAMRDAVSTIDWMRERERAAEAERDRKKRESQR